MRRNEARALTFEDPPDEKPLEVRVSKVESDIATIQVDIRELRGDMKAANESIADLKAAVATVDGKVNALSDKMDGKFDALNAKLDANVAALNKKIDTNFAVLNERINAHATSTDTRFVALDGKLDKLDAKVTETSKDLGDKIIAMGSKVDQLQGTVNAIGIAITVILGIATVGKLLLDAISH
jgi:chromosome segregation ATPase